MIMGTIIADANSLETSVHARRLTSLRWIAAATILLLVASSWLLHSTALPWLPLTTLAVSILLYNAGLRWSGQQPEFAHSTWLWPLTVILDTLALAALVHFTGGIESPALAIFPLYILIGGLTFPGPKAAGLAGLAAILVGMLTIGEAVGWLRHYNFDAQPASTQYRDPLFLILAVGLFALVLQGVAALTRPFAAELGGTRDRLSNLYKSIFSLSASLEKEEILSRLASALQRALPADGVAICLLDATGEALQIASTTGLASRLAERGEPPDPSVRTTVLEGRTIVMEAADDPQTLSADMIARGIRSMLCAPLNGSRRRLGLFCLYATSAGLFTSPNVELASAIGHQGASALECALALEELRRADSTKTQFVRMVTHELRSPVSGAQSLLRAAIQKLSHQPGGLVPDILDRIRIRLDTLQLLIDDLLDLAAGKVEGLEGELVPVAVEASILGVAERLASQIEDKGIAFDIDYIDRGLTVMASEQGIARIFLNLIGNAVKYTPHGGSVRVALKPQGSNVVVTVSDTGIGIPEVDRAHIFEEFYRASNATAGAAIGTGLGLAIVKDLVERYQGHISFSSHAGEGTCFTVSLPLAPEGKLAPFESVERA
jgi:signal transduction histidine kinase